MLSFSIWAVNALSKLEAPTSYICYQIPPRTGSTEVIIYLFIVSDVMNELRRRLLRWAMLLCFRVLYLWLRTRARLPSSL